jgi:hypothetical protein
VERTNCGDYVNPLSYGVNQTFRTTVSRWLLTRKNSKLFTFRTKQNARPENRVLAASQASAIVARVCTSLTVRHDSGIRFPSDWLAYIYFRYHNEPLVECITNNVVL